MRLVFSLWKRNNLRVKIMKKKWTNSKLIVWVIVFMYAEAVIYGQVAMWWFEDISSLPDMWVNVLPPIIAIIAYFIKSTLENRKGGITYDSAMKESEVEENERSENSSSESAEG